MGRGAITLAREHGFPILGIGTILRGWALADQGQSEEGISQIRQGLATCQAIGAGVFQSYYLALLAEAYGKAGQAEEGLATLAEALTVVDKNGERFYEAELYRLKGELTLQTVVSSESPVQAPNVQHPGRGGSRGVFSQSHRDRAKATSQIAGTPRHGQPRPPVATARQDRRSSPDVIRDLQLVHRRV